MRLSQWRKSAPNNEALNGNVLAMLQPILVDLGADADADCWVAWGDDPESRYSLLAPTDAGLVNVAIRLQGVDGPRATAKLVRWSKLSVSELSLESSGGHRLVAVQVESVILKGVDEEADRICKFTRGLIAGIDGRTAAAIPISVVQAVAGLGSAPGVAAPVVKGVPKPSPRAAQSNVAAQANPAVAGPKVAPTPSVTTAGTQIKADNPAKPSAKGAGNPAGLALVPSPSKVPGVPQPRQPGVPGESAAPPAGGPDKPNTGSPEAVPHPVPTPIAARAATAQHAEPPEPEPDRPAWIGPHPVGEPTKREPAKPRPWQP
jgi:hypothetical protein